MVILSITAAVSHIVFPLSVCMITAGCVILYQWRITAFHETYAQLNNAKRIAENEEACIHSHKTGKITYRCGKKHKPMVYFEYVYTVNDIAYYKSYFYEDDGDPLPVKCKMHYHMNKPSRAFREGSTRDGSIIGAGCISLGLIFFVGSVVNLVPL